MQLVDLGDYDRDPATEERVRQFPAADAEHAVRSASGDVAIRPQPARGSAALIVIAARSRPVRARVVARCRSLDAAGAAEHRFRQLAARPLRLSLCGRSRSAPDW